MSNASAANETEALRRLWAEYHLAITTIIEIMEREGTGSLALTKIVQAEIRASRAMRVIREILARSPQGEIEISLAFLDLPTAEGSAAL